MAGRDNAVEGVRRDGNSPKGETLEEGETESRRGRDLVRKSPVPKLGGDEGGREAEERGGGQRVAWIPVVVADVEILEVCEGWGVEPAVELGVAVGVVAEADGGEVEAAGGAGVDGEDGGDDGGAAEGVGAEGDPGVEVEGRGGAPEGPPPGGEGLRAGAVLDGEEGNHGAEDDVGEATDEIDADIGRGPACGRLHGRQRRRRRRRRRWARGKEGLVGGLGNRSGFWRRYEMDERPTYDSFRKRTPPVTFSRAAMERRAFITKSKRISNGSLNKNTLKLNMRYEKKIYQSKLLDCVL